MALFFLHCDWRKVVNVEKFIGSSYLLIILIKRGLYHSALFIRDGKSLVFYGFRFFQAFRCPTAFGAKDYIFVESNDAIGNSL